MQEPEATPVEEPTEITEAPDEPTGESVEEEEETPAGEAEPTAEELAQQKIDAAEERARKAEARRAWVERENKRLQKVEQPPEQPPEPAREKPTPEQYEDYDDYVDDLTDWKIEQKEVTRRVEARQAERQKQGQDFFAEGAKKHEDLVKKIRADLDDQPIRWRLKNISQRHEDFVEVVRNDDVPLTEDVVNALLDCDHAADVAYHLGKNIPEAHRIASLDPGRMRIEIGKLEAQLTGPNPPPQKVKTGAPNPTSPVGGTETPSKKLEDMSTAEYIAHQNRKEGIKDD